MEVNKRIHRKKKVYPTPLKRALELFLPGHLPGSPLAP